MSDDGGEFRVSRVLPGRYTVTAELAGYEAASRRVEVRAGEVAQVELPLRPLPTGHAFAESFGPFAGYFECQWATTFFTVPCGDVCVAVCVGPSSLVDPALLYPNDVMVAHFELSADSPGDIVGEMQWTPGTYATSDSLRLRFSHAQRTGNHFWCTDQGTSPIRWLWDNAMRLCNGEPTPNGAGDDPPRPTMEHDLILYVNLTPGFLNHNNPTGDQKPFRMTVQQRFDTMATVFYFSQAPEGYSAFVDS